MSTQMIAADPTETLEQLALFSDLNDRAKRFFAQTAEMTTIKRHEYLIRRDGPADCFFVVVQGRVEVSLSADGGFSKVIEIAGPGDQIGEAMMFCGGNHLIDARAITAVTYIRINKANALQAMQLDNSFAVHMIQAMSARFVTLLADIRSTNCLSARERIYQFLLKEPRQNNWVRLTVTKGTIASILGIAKETLSRELQRLSSDGLIRVQGTRIELIDPPPVQAPCPNLPR